MMMTPAAAANPYVPAQLAIARAVRELPDVFSWTFDVPGGFPFLPGQFNMLYVHGVGEVPISISGDPAAPERLVHTIRAVGTVTRAMARLGEGDVLGVRGPYGAAWPVDLARGRDVLVIAGGLGLAPLRPAILHLLARRADYGRVTILYGARTPPICSTARSSSAGAAGSTSASRRSSIAPGATGSGRSAWSRACSTPSRSSPTTPRSCAARRS